VISRREFRERARDWGLREEIVEKDYAIGWILWGIGSESLLQKTWCFKGGTCIKKCFIETYRFSEDLDFSVLPGGSIVPDDLSPLFDVILARVNEASGIDFTA
jgi:predicted nucleotidyltransferase component of viral defense system